MKLAIKFLLFVQCEDGQALIEYVLILVLLAIVVILMMTGLGGTVNSTYSKINSALP